MEFEKLNPLDFEEINIIPLNDCIQHTDGLECICCPTWDGQNQWALLAKTDCRMVVVHRRIAEELQ